MESILTLNIDQNVIKNAEIYAKNTQKTVSQLVEEYLSSISSNTMITDKPLGPITAQLIGIIKLDEDVDHKGLLTDALMEKYL